MRKKATTGIIAIIALALILQSGGGMAGEAACRTEEYELMSLLIREQYGSEFSLILIGRDTESSYLREHLGFLKKTWPRLKGETIDSLIVSYRAEPRRLAESFSLPVEYRLLSDADYMKVLRAGSESLAGGTLAAGTDVAGTGMEAYAAMGGAVEPDWDNFDTVYPDAQGYLIFSRVAFDSECTQALLVFSNAYRCKGVRTRPQTREIAFFSKKDGVWVLVGVSRDVQAMD
jgi:hypothetical protein